jgi:hypothetical protein
MLAQKIIDYHLSLSYNDLILPQGIGLMNPVREHSHIREIVERFYQKFYNDDLTRTMIIGINPGRLGAGSTGLPFTDTKRLKEFCGIEIPQLYTHEPSSVFVYDVIQAMGGVEIFYKDFYVTSAFPLGFTTTSGLGKAINYNYYDSAELQKLTTPYIVKHLHHQINMGCKTDKAFVLGMGKNYAFLNKINEKHHFFENLIPLEHPRYIMQYKLKSKDSYIADYLNKLIG